MTAIEQLLADSLRARAEHAKSAIDVVASAADLTSRLDATDQHRRRLSLLAVAAAITVVLAAVGLTALAVSSGIRTEPPVTGPLPTVSPSPLSLVDAHRCIPHCRTASPALALAQSYTSNTQHYVIAYPKGWSLIPATSVWTYPNDRGDVFPNPMGDTFVAPGRSVVDQVGRHDSAGLVTVTSQLIPGGVSDQDWLLRYPGSGGPKGSERSDCYPNSFSQLQPTVIDGHPAWINPRGCDVDEAVVIVNRRAYLFVSMTAFDKVNVAFDRDLFETMLSSFWAR